MMGSTSKQGGRLASQSASQPYPWEQLEMRLGGMGPQPHSTPRRRDAFLGQNPPQPGGSASARVRSRDRG